MSRQDLLARSHNSMPRPASDPIMTVGTFFDYHRAFFTPVFNLAVSHLDRMLRHPAICDKLFRRLIEQCCSANRHPVSIGRHEVMEFIHQVLNRSSIKVACCGQQQQEQQQLDEQAAMKVTISDAAATLSVDVRYIFCSSPSYLPRCSALLMVQLLEAVTAVLMVSVCKQQQKASAAQAAPQGGGAQWSATAMSFQDTVLKCRLVSGAGPSASSPYDQPLRVHAVIPGKDKVIPFTDKHDVYVNELVTWLTSKELCFLPPRPRQHRHPSTAEGSHPASLLSGSMPQIDLLDLMRTRQALLLSAADPVAASILELTSPLYAAPPAPLVQTVQAKKRRQPWHPVAQKLLQVIAKHAYCHLINAYELQRLGQSLDALPDAWAFQCRLLDSFLDAAEHSLKVADRQHAKVLTQQCAVLLQYLKALCLEMLPLAPPGSVHQTSQRNDREYPHLTLERRMRYRNDRETAMKRIPLHGVMDCFTIVHLLEQPLEDESGGTSVAQLSSTVDLSAIKARLRRQPPPYATYGDFIVDLRGAFVSYFQQQTAYSYGADLLMKRLDKTLPMLTLRVMDNSQRGQVEAATALLSCKLQQWQAGQKRKKSESALQVLSEQL